MKKYLLISTILLLCTAFIVYAEADIAEYSFTIESDLNPNLAVEYGQLQSFEISTDSADYEVSEYGEGTEWVYKTEEGEWTEFDQDIPYCPYVYYGDNRDYNTEYGIAIALTPNDETTLSKPTSLNINGEIIDESRIDFSENTIYVNMGKAQEKDVYSIDKINIYESLEGETVTSCDITKGNLKKLFFTVGPSYATNPNIRCEIADTTIADFNEDYYNEDGYMTLTGLEVGQTELKVYSVSNPQIYSIVILNVIPDKSEIVDEVDITGLDNPLEGVEPDTEVSVNARAFNVAVGDIEWLDEEGCKVQEFKAGSQYTVHIPLVLVSCYLSDDTVATVNGYKADLNTSTGAVEYTFTAEEPVYHVVYKGTIDEGVTIEGMSDYNVLEGNNYNFKVVLKNGYRKTDEFKVTANNEELESINGIYTIYNITKAQQIDVTGVTGYTSFQFMANGGEGKAFRMTANQGESFTFPKCTFEAPDGYEFSYWLFNGSLYKSGTTITVNTTGLKYVKAVWKEQPTVLITGIDNYTYVPKGKTLSCYFVLQNFENNGNTFKVYIDKTFKKTVTTKSVITKANISTGSLNAGKHTIYVKQNGNIVGESSFTINKASAKLTLTPSTFFYNGKKHRPEVSTLSNGTVTNPYRTLPGNYKVNVAAGTNYKSVSATYNIVVKPTAISYARKSGEVLSVKANKQSSTYIAGYQFRYSTNSNMNNATIKNTTSNTIQKKTNATYVQVRTYVKISGKPYYSAWSKTVKAN